MSTIQKLRSLELYLAAHPDCVEHSECADRLSDVQELLKEIPDPTAQLQADKEELLSMLGKAYEYLEEIGMVVPNKEWTEQFRDRWNGKLNEVESLIQKHKPCGIK